VNIEKAGRYDVYLEYSVSDESAGKFFSFKIGKKKLQGKAEKTGSWFTYKREKIGTVRLPEGIQHAAILSDSKKDKGSMFDLREVKLVPVK
jgi:hypothetical protein